MHSQFRPKQIYDRHKRVSKKQRNDILNNICHFAFNKVPYLRIELELESEPLVRFNAEATGVIPLAIEDPSIFAYLQKLTVDVKTGLPFDTILFRRQNRGPGLARIQFKNGRFVLAFNEGFERKLIDFCERLNRFIAFPLNLTPTWMQEEKFQRVFKRLYKKDVLKTLKEKFSVDLSYKHMFYKDLKTIGSWKGYKQYPLEILQQFLLRLEESVKINVEILNKRMQLAEYLIHFAEKTNCFMALENIFPLRSDHINLEKIDNNSSYLDAKSIQTLLHVLKVDHQTNLPFERVIFKKDEMGPALAEVDFKTNYLMVDFSDSFYHEFCAFRNRLNTLIYSDDSPDLAQTFQKDKKDKNFVANMIIGARSPNSINAIVRAGLFAKTSEATEKNKEKYLCASTALPRFY